MLAIPQLKQGHAADGGQRRLDSGSPRHSTLRDYCASKFALRGLSESLRAELAPLEIDLLLVSPGRTETPFLDHSLAREDVAWDNEPAVNAGVCRSADARAIESAATKSSSTCRGQLWCGSIGFLPGFWTAFWPSTAEQGRGGHDSGRAQCDRRPCQETCNPQVFALFYAEPSALALNVKSRDRPLRPTHLPRPHSWSLA